MTEMSESINTQPQHQTLLGASDYEMALDTLLGKAGRTLRIFEHTLGRSWNNAHRHDILRMFLHADRLNRLYIVVHRADNIARDCPRLMLLLKQFSHSIAIHETHDHVKSVSDPFAVADERHFLRRFHYVDMRGQFGQDDPNGAHQLIDRFNDLWEASQPAVSATTLGL
ncbi:MAG: hypothetical protein AB1513_06795 [Pseudomonadota bacterium]